MFVGIRCPHCPTQSVRENVTEKDIIHCNGCKRFYVIAITEEGEPFLVQRSIQQIEKLTMT